MTPALARRLGVSDVVLIVIGSVIGSGIFRTPSVVAQRIPIPGLILVAWACGGVVALFGAFVLGELAARRPAGCGAYAYLRDAFHPVVAFAYGWSSLLASFTGGIAAAAVLFAGYFLSLTSLGVAPGVLAAVTLAVVAFVNCFGVRSGSNVQGALTVLKIAALAALIVAGIVAHPAQGHQVAALSSSTLGMLGAFSVAMIPVLFAYNGAMVANFMAAEAKNVTFTLPLGLWLGISGAALLYLLVNVACLRVLGVEGLANTSVPASAVLRAAAGPAGAQVASFAIAVSTLGFISNRMLTIPRLYHAMAEDGLFFRAVAWIDPRTRVPVVAIALQAAFAMLLALSGSYENILNYVVSTFYVFNGLLALALFIIRARDRDADGAQIVRFRVPGHPFTTALYLLVSWGVAIATYVAYPRDAIVGIAILLSAVPVYFTWTRARRF
ncbi:MAG TPA: amino acid permease [Candidatus Cybelea sp.]|nr:amino acid permease [Candidatus Cybelea sp.]